MSTVVNNFFTLNEARGRRFHPALKQRFAAIEALLVRHNVLVLPRGGPPALACAPQEGDDPYVNCMFMWLHNAPNVFIIRVTNAATNPTAIFYKDGMQVIRSFPLNTPEEETTVADFLIIYCCRGQSP